MKIRIFSYELCVFPAALFVSPILPRLPNKASLALYMWNLIDEGDRDIHFHANDVHFVLDGGALLHKLVWPKDYSYN